MAGDSAGDVKTLLLLGNTGIGKSSVGCRLLGFEPDASGKLPFKVAPTGASVTLHVDVGNGHWFGKPEFPLVRVVDTPGLGDKDGPAHDTKNMIKVGKYLDKHPVHCVVMVVRASLPRVDYTLKGLLNLMATKIGRDDYSNLGIIVNAYSHDDNSRRKRAHNSNPRGRSESDTQAAIREELAVSLREFAEAGQLAFDEKHIATIVSHTFFVDSHYVPWESPEDNHSAFMDFSTWVCTCEEMNRKEMGKGVAAVHVELEEANRRKQELEDQLNEVAAKFKQELEIVQEQRRQDIANIKREHEERALELQSQLEQQHKEALKLAGEQQKAALEKADELHKKEKKKLEKQIAARTAEADKRAADAVQHLENARATTQAKDNEKLDRLEVLVHELILRADKPQPVPQVQQIPTGFIGETGVFKDVMKVMMGPIAGGIMTVMERKNREKTGKLGA